MLHPQEMTEIEMIVPSRDVLAVTKVLSGHGIFHQGESAYTSPDANADKNNTWQESAVAYAAIERRIQTIMQTLSIDEGPAPTTEFETLPDLNIVRPVIDKIEQDVKKITEQLTAGNKQLEQLESNLRQLETVADIDLDISTLHNQRFLYITLGTLPAANVERLQSSLLRIPFVFTVLRQDPQKPVVWLAGSQSNADVLERAARSAYLNPLSLPDGYEGTPAEIIKLIHTNIQKTQDNIVELKQALLQLGKTDREELQKLIWNVRASRLLTDAIVHFGRLRYTYLIVGWVPTAQLDTLIERIKQVSKETLVETYSIKRSGANQNVPVSLKNSKWLKPFQMLVTTYATPCYGEIDPTWLIAITFPVIFGAMFGDVGQGLVLVLVGWLLSNRKIKALNSMASLGDLITACGLAATVFGFLYGSVFGFENVLPALWMRPIDNIMSILTIAIGGGLILLSLGYLLNIYNCFIEQDWGKLLFDHNGVAGLVLYWSLLGLVGGVFLKIPVPSSIFITGAIIGALAIMFSEALEHLVEGYRPVIEDSIGTYAIQAFFELFETVIGMLSNSLSYVRVGAFAVAHGGLSAAIFVLADLAHGSLGLVGYIIVVILGNIFIVGFEGLIVGIQTMRLSYYELFSKFFTGGGKRYEPLNLYPSKSE
ncbi:MAG TPA: V-type ATPase 116kDa subunit family protein [Anaerolineaceae bacterium]|nr:V-type ATPase 116kDa subunit family protein [Anaerolineaceae bacterium]